MQETVILSSRDAILYALPLVVVLLVAMFRLDELFCARKTPPKQERDQQMHLRKGPSPMFSDPDGRPWRA
jgi:hypothetical protein